MNDEFEPTAIDLFCGAGGLSWGFKKAGFRVVAAIDNNKDMVKTYKFNHPETTVICKDIREIDAEELLSKSSFGAGKIDVVIGGPPCEGFSSVGYRREDDPRNSLFWEFLRIVGEVNPKVFLLENVPGLLSMKRGRIVARAVEICRENGWKVNLQVLNAADFGVPQIRERVFFLGTRDTILKFPTPTHSEKPRRMLLATTSPYLTVEDAISDLPHLDAGGGEEETDYPGPPKTEYQKERRKNSEKLYDHIAPRHESLTIERIKRIPPGGNHRDLPKFLQLKSGYPNIYGRLHWKRHADTITGNAGCASAPGRFIHPSDNRVITVREAARLQSFDDVFRFFGNLRSKYKQVGDAVPPLLAEAIAVKVKSYIEKVRSRD